MDEKRMNDERLAQLIRAAAPRRETPVGLETRIMAQIGLRDRRRRERRAVAVVAFACLQSVDSSEGAVLAGAVAEMVIACSDRATEILRRL